MINFMKKIWLAIVTPQEPSPQEKCADVVLTSLEKDKDNITFIWNNVMTPHCRDNEGELLFYRNSTCPFHKPGALSGYELTREQTKRFNKLVNEIYTRDEKKLFSEIANKIESGF